MRKIINKINIEKILVSFLVLQPIVDLITSLTYRFMGSFATLGVIVKGLFMVLLTFFVLYKYKFKDRKASTIFIIAFSIYEIIYLALNVSLKSNLVFISELKSSIKTFFVPFTIILLYDTLKNEKFNFKSRVFSYILIEYVVLIFIANLTGTSFNTYVGEKIGSIGWFYAGNDIGSILISLFPILYFYYIKTFNASILFFILLSIYVILGIGTKVTALGLGIIIILLIVLFVLNYIFKKNKLKFKKNLIALIIIVAFVTLLLPSSPIVKNMELHYNNVSGNSDGLENKDKQDDSEIVDDLIFSGRTEFKKAALKRYKSSSVLEKLFGMGYVDKNNKEYKLVERDCFDIFFNHGIVGSIIQLCVLTFIAGYMLILIFKKPVNNLFRMNIENYVISIALMLGISFYSGHILLNPSVGIYFSAILISLFFRIYNIYKMPFRKEENNKVTIMALHLKPGGIEKFISTTSKFLSKKYEVEIVSVYKYKKQEIVNIDKNIKINYLLEEKYKPNKDKIKLSLKNKKIFNLIKESFFALKIIILKNVRMINFIKNCDSSIIISTRKEHNAILSEYGSASAIKIATEHNYYSKKYSEKVLNSCSDIDYFVVSTEDQKDYYKKLFTGINTMVIKIPFALENIPKEFSKLNNYNLIAIGRLSKEKGFDDLIDLFSRLIIRNSKFKLKIIGYGDEEENLKKQIKSLKLEKNVVLCGRKNSEEIQKELLNSSMLVMTSHIESFGIVLIEAMSCGVPCIIFDDAKGACEIIKDNYNGFIITNRDKEKYISKILDTFKDEKKLKTIGMNAKEYSKKFDIENIESLWLKLLEGCL